MHLGLFLLLALIWGGTFVAIKIAVGVLPPFFAAAARIGLGSLIALAAMRVQGVAWPSRREWRVCTMLGVIGMGIPWLMLFWGQKHISAGLGSIMNSTVPIFAMLYSFLFFRDRDETAWHKVLGVFCGFVGVAVIFYPDLLNAWRTEEALSLHLLGMLALMGMSLSYGLHLILVKRLAGNINRHKNIFVQALAAFVVLGGMSALFELPRIGPALQQPGADLAIWSIVCLAVFSTFVALQIFFYLVQKIGAIRSGAVTYLVPLVAVAIDWFAFRIAPTWNEWMGTMMIFVGITLINLKAWLSARRARRGALESAA